MTQICLTCCVCFEGIDFCLESSDGSRLTADGVTEAVNPAVSAADVIAQVIVPAREIVVAILIDHCTHQVWPLAKIFLAFEYLVQVRRGEGIATLGRIITSFCLGCFNLSKR